MNDYLVLYLIVAVIFFLLGIVKDIKIIKLKKVKINLFQTILMIIINIIYGFLWWLALGYQFFRTEDEVTK